VICAWLSLLTVIVYLRRSHLAPLVCSALRWRRPEMSKLRELVGLGLPMGLSSCVEVAAFTLIALFIARLGAPTVGAHRIVANLVALAYMLPLAVAVATLTQVGVAVGAGRFDEARRVARAGLVLGTLASLALMGLQGWQAEAVVGMFSSDAEVRGIGLSLLVYVLSYQLFDCWQTIAGFCLRAYKVTAAPLVIHVLSFWGVGLGVGYWLAFLSPWQNGVVGYWQAAVGSVVVSAALLLLLLHWVERRRVAG
jgi:MATE family multidrug resistance protein